MMAVWRWIWLSTIVCSAVLVLSDVQAGTGHHEGTPFIRPTTGEVFLNSKDRAGRASNRLREARAGHGDDPEPVCACPLDEPDTDGDGVCDRCDNCPKVRNQRQRDIDEDRAGDVCDNCPTDPNENQTDSDEDSLGDVCDNCRNDVNVDQADSDYDGVGDVCDNCREDINVDQADSDYDGVGNVCDNCPYVSNPGQMDEDQDGVGDGFEASCDLCPGTVGGECVNDDGCSCPDLEALIDDGNPCTDDYCECGSIEHEAVAHGAFCDDDDRCTTDDECTGGACGGARVDCTYLDDDCNIGVCNGDTGECEATPNNEGDACDDGAFCTSGEVCSSGGCGGGLPTDCSNFDDQCTVGVCNENADTCEAEPTNEGQGCDDGDSCTEEDTCAGGACAGVCNDGDGDGACNPCDVCDGRDDFRFDVGGSCPDSLFHLAVLQESSGLNRTTSDPPVALEDALSCPSFVVEIWATKFSPDVDPNWPSDPGIACAFVDLVSHLGVAAEISMEWGELFDTLHSGTFGGDGGVTDLGACTTAEGGVGVWPEWVLLARIELEQDYDANVSFDLQASAFGTSVFGQGFAAPVDYGEACTSTVDCRGHIYDLDSDCYIGPGDLGLFAGCWLMCPDDPGYDTGLLGESCDGANFAKCSADDCVGPEDFSYLMTAWQKHCDALDIELPDCDGMLAAQAYPPPLPSAEVLRSFGLEPPIAKWKGYRRGILRRSRELDVKRSISRSTQR